MNRGTRDTHSAEAGAVPSSGDSTDLASAVAVLAGVSLTDADADTALEVVLAARHAAAAALAVEADALARLAETYPECGMSGRDALHRAVVFELMAAMGARSCRPPTGWRWGSPWPHSRRWGLPCGPGPWTCRRA